jgi:hypothetical protein
MSYVLELKCFVHGQFCVFCAGARILRVWPGPSGFG